MNQKQELEVRRAADRIRLRVLEHTVSQNGGYLSQACSSADLFATLYMRVLKLAKLEKPLMPKKFKAVPGPKQKAVTGARFNGNGDRDCDSFILSPAQYALVLYAALIETGRMDARAMKEYNKDGSSVEMIGAEHSPGMEVTTGSLGQGISQAAGIAFARKVRGDKGRVVVMLSDGECQSGEFWEAVQAASYHDLGNLICFVDVNGFQCDGKMTTVMNLEPFDDRLRAFGARVFRIDGHDVQEIERIAKMRPSKKPTFVLCDTDPTRGLPFLKERYPKFHYVRFLDPKDRERYRGYYEKLAAKGDLTATAAIEAEKAAAEKAAAGNAAGKEA